MKVLCPGYRDIQDLMFRDETATTMRRAGAGQNSLAALHKFHEGPDRSHSSLNVRASGMSHQALHLGPHYSSFEADPTMTPSLPPFQDDFGVTYFFSKFVVSDSIPRRLPTEFVEKLLQEDQSNLLLASITAVGIAALANTNRSSTIAIAARQKYIYALLLTRKALNDLSCHQVTVLMSVLLLAMFEVREGVLFLSFRY